MEKLHTKGGVIVVVTVRFSQDCHRVPNTEDL